MSPRWHRNHLPFTCTISRNRDIQEKMDRKTKLIAYSSGTALVPLTPHFHLCNLQNSRYWKKLLDRKTKILPYCSWYCLSSADISFTCATARNRYQKKVLDRKIKNHSNWSVHCVGTVNSSLLPVRDIEEINFWTKKWKYSQTAQCTSLAPLTSPFYLCEISKKKILDRKTKILAYCSGHRVGTVNTSL